MTKNIKKLDNTNKYYLKSENNVHFHYSVYINYIYFYINYYNYKV